MRKYKADLHVHTLLSPCGSLDMSPVNIVDAALNAQLDIIAITDHNSTKQAKLIKRLAEKKGMTVFCGAEINSAEEVHCLVIFETDEQLDLFQLFIDKNMRPVRNKPSVFGEQVVVDENEMIVEEVKYLLINALDASLMEIEHYAHEIGGLVIPAHVDRYYNGLFSQLGFMPTGLRVDAFEISKNAPTREWETNGKIPSGATIIRNSDAHVPEKIGKSFTYYLMEAPVFSELKLALHGLEGRKAFIT